MAIISRTSQLITQILRDTLRWCFSKPFMRTPMQKIAFALFTGISLAVIAPLSSAGAADLFVGAFESEARANFGTDNPGEYRIEVAALGSERYSITLFRAGGQQRRGEVFSCPVSSEGYLARRPSGRAEVLCAAPRSPVMFYSENGIEVPTFEPWAKGAPAANPSSVPKMKLHRTKFYAHVGMAVYGFKKVR